MKKMVSILLTLLLLVGCTNENNNENSNYENNNNQSKQLKDPVLKWCDLYNPNGFDTITCFLSNPNDVDIDIKYDLVFYKDKKEVSRQNWSNFQISPDHDEVIWGNFEIPKSIDVDEVKMENITVTKSYYDSIDADIKYTGTVENEMHFSINHETEPTLDTITFVLYDDKNNNKQCDKGEIVITEIYSTTEKEDIISLDISDYNYNEYEIYYNAY